MQEARPYIPKHKIRIVTAASLFDGHDAAINIMRRIIQSTGVEVIHLGHDRSVEEVVNCAIQEDAHAIAMTSYQGGHMERSQNCRTTASPASITRTMAGRWGCKG
jgi:methylmalonyl-CoA mutase